ncbi:MAG: hypothetical protein V7647_470 [Acidobacteriota bacterium]
MHITELAAQLSGTGWLTPADATLKATLLFAAAGVASLALRRGTAASRHLLWMLALTSALAVPLLSLSLPRWQFPLVTLTSAAAAPDQPTDAHVPPIAPHPMMSAPARGARSEAPEAARRAEPQSHVSSIPSLPALSLPVALLAGWGIGAGIVLLRLAIGLVGVMWLSRSTERVISAPWLPLARELAADLGVSPRVAFLRSREAAMPMAWGVFRPAVLMPADADTWSSERLRIVLLHELAHVKRRDCLTHMVAQLACAVYWFNPLAWMAARHLRAERERACDDLVLAAGTRGPDYADQLLQIARAMRSDRFPAIFAGASLAMARRSQLEGRLMAILDPTVPRAGISRIKTAAAASLFACAVVPLAAMQPWSIAAAAMPVVVAAAAPADGTTQLRDGESPLLPAAAPVVQPVPAPAAPRRRPAASAPSLADSIAESTADAVRAGIAVTVPSVVTSVMAAVGPLAPGLQDAGKGKQADPRLVAALTAALKDTDKDVRETALQALVRLRDPAIFEPLVQALADAAADVREHAAFGLGQMRDKRAVEPLTRALKDQNGDVREQAAFALGQIRDRSAVAALTAALKDAEADVREQVVFALGQLRDPAAIEGLALAAHDAKADVRQQAVFALGQLRDPRSVEPLISALKDTDGDVREQAAFALGQIRDHSAVEPLIIALKDTVADVRQQVAFALGQIRDPRALDALTAALKDANADVRQQAAFALGQLAR